MPNQPPGPCQGQGPLGQKSESGSEREVVDSIQYSHGGEDVGVYSGWLGMEQTAKERFGSPVRARGQAPQNAVKSMGPECLGRLCSCFLTG